VIDSEKLVREFEEKYKSYEEEHKKMTKYKNQITWCLFFGLIISLVVLITVIFDNGNMPIYKGVLVVIGFMLCIFSIIQRVRFYKFMDDYKGKYYNAISEFLLNKYYSDVKLYKDDVFNVKEEFNNVKYVKYKTKINHYNSMELSYKEYIIRSMNISASVSAGETDTSIFCGLFNKIFLSEDTGVRLSIVNKKDYYGKQIPDAKIDIDSTEFENKFNVYADDKVKAMQILTADVIEGLMEIANSDLNVFDIYIDKHTLYIRIMFNTPMFEMGESLADKDIIDKNNKRLSTLNKVIDVLSTSELIKKKQ